MSKKAIEAKAPKIFLAISLEECNHAQHSSALSAETEAARLAVLNPGKSYQVFALQSVFAVTDIKATKVTI